MELKISWGWRISLLYVGFVAMILILVWKSTTQKIDLVADNYYEQELRFQQRIDQSKRAKSLPTPLKWSVSDSEIIIQYPNLSAQPVVGEVRFYCPSDNGKDASFQIVTNETLQQTIPISKLKPARYQIQIQWKTGDLTYWDEGVVNIGVER